MRTQGILYCILVCLTFLLPFETVKAQGVGSLVDSLIVSFEQEITPERKAALAYNIAYKLQNTSPDKALEYAHVAAENYLSMGNRLWYGKSLHLRYAIAVNMGNITLAVKSILAAQAVYKELHLNLEVAATTLDLALVASKCQDYVASYNYLNEAKPIIFAQSNSWYKGQWNIQFGFWHSEQGHWNAALPYFKSALVQFSDTRDRVLAGLYVANNYMNNNQFDSAFLQLNIVQQEAVFAPDSSYWLARILHEKAAVAWKQGKLTEAFSQLSNALPAIQAFTGERFQLAVINNLAEVALELQAYVEADNNLSKALALTAAVDDDIEVVRTYSLLVSYYKAVGNTEKALEYSEGRFASMAYQSEVDAVIAKLKQQEEWEVVMAEAETEIKHNNQLAVKRATNIAVGSIVLLVIVVITALALFLLYRSRLQKRIIKALEATNDASQEKIRLLKKSNETDDWILKFIANRKR